MKTIKIICGTLVGSLLATGAMAATTWNVGEFLDLGNTSTLQAKSASAWSTTGSGGTLASGCVQNYGSWGYGVVNAIEDGSPANCDVTSPQHAADNSGGQTDMFLLEFLAPVTLTQINIGWNGDDNYSADSDLSVLAYMGTGSGSSAVAGNTLSGLTGSGWAVVGNYSNVGDSNGTGFGGSASITTTTASSWWLVSAYNQAFGQTWSQADDYFKLLSVAGNTQPPGNQTPEPGSLVLLGAGLFGMMAMRRRRESGT